MTLQIASHQGVTTSNVLRGSLDLLTEEELSTALEVTEATLADWRKNNQGPDYCKLGRTVFYRREDVLQWIKMSVVPTQRNRAA